jgi:hypothetical protein
LQPFEAEVPGLHALLEESLALLKNSLVKNKTLIYICRNKAFVLPVMGNDQALRQIQYPLF